MLSEKRGRTVEIAYKQTGEDAGETEKGRGGTQGYGRWSVQRKKCGK